jgi:histidine triad (HIT) family protein
MTLFEKIAARQIPAEILREDHVAFAIRDIHPQAPTHILIIPKRPIPRLHDADELDGETLGHLLLMARGIAADLGLDARGYRVVINCGPDAGESVPHLHVHLLAGRPMGWPPG